MYGVTGLKIEFDVKFFISEGSEIDIYIKKSEIYFPRGIFETITYIEDDGETDWSA